MPCRIPSSMIATGCPKSRTARRPLEDRPGVAQIGVDVGRRPLGAAGQQDTGVVEHDRVVVHVHHPGLRRRRLRDLVGVVGRRQPGPDVEELPDARLRDQEVHRPGQERPLGPDRDPDIRVGGGDPLGNGAVGREIVLAAQPEVVHPGHVRPARVERDARARRPLTARHLARLSGWIDPNAGNAPALRWLAQLGHSSPAQPDIAPTARRRLVSVLTRDRARAGAQSQ